MIVIFIFAAVSVVAGFVAYRLYQRSKAQQVVQRRRILPLSTEVRLDELRQTLEAIGHDKITQPAAIRKHLADQHMQRGTLPFTLLSLVIDCDSTGPSQESKDLVDALKGLDHLVVHFSLHRSPSFFPTRSNIRGIIKEIQILGRDWQAVAVYFRGNVSPKERDFGLVLQNEYEGNEKELITVNELATKLIDGLRLTPCITVIVDTAAEIPKNIELCSRWNVNLVGGKNITNTLVEGFKSAGIVQKTPISGFGGAFTPPSICGNVETTVFHCGDVSADSVSEYLRRRCVELSIVNINAPSLCTPFASQRALRPHMCPLMPMKIVPREGLILKTQALLEDKQRVVVKGKLGSGKSTLLVALCWHKKTLDRYTDGVFYLDCHDHDITERRLSDYLSTITYASCGSHVKYVKMDEAEEYFNTLKGKKMLFVVDGIDDSSWLKKLEKSLGLDSNGTSIVIGTSNDDVASDAPAISSDNWEREEFVEFASKVLGLSATRIPESTVNPYIQKLLVDNSSFQYTEEVPVNIIFDVSFEKLPENEVKILKVIRCLPCSATVDNLLFYSGLTSRPEVRRHLIDLQKKGWINWVGSAITLHHRVKPWMSKKFVKGDLKASRQNILEVYKKKAQFTEESSPAHWIEAVRNTDEVYFRTIISLLAEFDSPTAVKLLSSLAWLENHAAATSIMYTAEDMANYATSQVPLPLRQAIPAVAIELHRCPWEFTSQMYEFLFEVPGAQAFLDELGRDSIPLPWGDDIPKGSMWLRRISTKRGQGPTSGVTALCLPSTKWTDVEHPIIAGHNDGTVSVWNAITGEFVKSFLRAHGSSITSILETSEGMIATGSRADRSIRVWDTSTETNTVVTILPKSSAEKRASSRLCAVLGYHGVEGTSLPDQRNSTGDVVILRTIENNDDDVEVIEFNGKCNTCNCAATMTFSKLITCARLVNFEDKTKLLMGFCDGSVVVYGVEIK